MQYKCEEHKMLMLDIPIEAALNKEEVESYKEREMKRQKLREADADMEITQEGMENGVPKASAITRDSDEEKVLPKVLKHKQFVQGGNWEVHEAKNHGLVIFS